MKDNAEIGIFGGTGLYDSGLLEDSKEITIKTPYGNPSDSITIGIFKGRKIAFLPRHGKKHTIPPHKINFRANIWAFKELGIKRIIAPSAVGSLKEEFQPGHFAIPNQFLDFTKSRINSFSDIDKVIHISVADPFCPELQKTIIKVSKNQDMEVHQECKACLRHSFVRGLADGSLDETAFRHYLAQDAFFLEAFGRAYALALAKCRDKSQNQHFLHPPFPPLLLLIQEMSWHAYWKPHQRIPAPKHP